MALYLRTIRQDGMSFFPEGRKNGFKWPVGKDAVGQKVTAPDWDPTSVRGGGLHGLKWGMGDHTCLRDQPDSVWQVVFVPDGKEVAIVDDRDPDFALCYKFPYCIIVHSGDKASATQYIYKKAPLGTKVHYLKIHTEDALHIVGGYGSDLSGGDYSILVAMGGSTLDGGHESILIAGDESKLGAGSQSRLTGGKRCTLVSGSRSWLEAGYDSQLTSGYDSVLRGGDLSVMKAGEGSSFRWSIRVNGIYVESSIYTNIDPTEKYHGEFYRSFWTFWKDFTFKMKKL